MKDEGVSCREKKDVRERERYGGEWERTIEILLLILPSGHLGTATWPLGAHLPESTYPAV